MKSDQVQLSDVCNLIAGFAFKSKHFGNYKNKVIKIANITPPTVSMNNLVGVNLSQYNSSKLGRFVAHTGDYVIAMTGATIGKIGRIESGDAYINQRVLLFRSKEDKIDKDFLYYTLQQYEFEQYVLGHIDSESAQPNISAGTIGKYQFHLPCMDSQIGIGRFLRMLDEKIELNRKINDNLEQQARTLLVQWMMENEGNYKVFSLTDVAEINPDTYSPKNAWEYVNYLDTSSIIDGIISEVQYINPSTEKLPSRARRIISANDVVFSTVRPNQRHYGIICEPVSHMLASTGFAVVRSKHPYVSNELLYLCLTENSFVEKMQQLAEQSTSTFPSIKPSDLSSCEIPCPIDQCLSDALKAMFMCIYSTQRENASLAALRNALLPKLMSGEIDISAIQF